MIENACHLSKSPIKMYRNYTVCVHVHNLHPGANKFAPPRRQEQICTRVQIFTRVQILKTPFTWPKYPRVQICTHVAYLHPGANCAHERGFKSYRLLYIYQFDRDANLNLEIRIVRFYKSFTNKFHLSSIIKSI